MSTILQVQGMQKYYGSRGVVTKAVDNISFSVEEGEYVGIMGVSGAGEDHPFDTQRVQFTDSSCSSTSVFSCADISPNVSLNIACVISTLSPSHLEIRGLDGPLPAPRPPSASAPAPPRAARPAG